MVHGHSPVPDDPGVLAFDDEVAGLLELIDEAEKRVRSLEEPADPGCDAVTGESPGARENRSVRFVRARLAVREAREVRAALAEVRRRAAVMAEEARAASRATREHRARTTDARHDDVPAADVGSRLAGVLDRAARTLLVPGDEEHAVEGSLRRIVEAALDAVPHAERAGVSLLARDGSITSHAPTDEVVADLDQLQVRLDEGPCRDAIAHREHFLVEDMAAEGARWPRFAEAAAARGIGSLLSFQLFNHHDGSAGALNLYSTDAGAFDARSLDIGSLYASHAAVALHGAQRVAGLTEALRSRDVIGQAKGILTERFGLADEQQAFTMLVTSSQETNLKLRAVAEWVVAETARRAAPGGAER